jgi:hypothetical protein
MRGIVAAYAMARPRRCAAEAAAIAAALASLPADLSLRSKARLLAQRVVEELLADAVADDPFDRALRAARQVLGQSPILALAADADINLAGDLAQERLQRFEARGCRQISESAWQAETREIAKVLCARFAERFRRSQKMGAN